MQLWTTSGERVACHLVRPQGGSGIHEMDSKVEKHYGANCICFRCKANKTPGQWLYTNFDLDAPWSLDQLTTHEAIDATLDHVPLYRIDGWNHLRVLFDIMHVLHLGVLRQFAGSCVVLLAQHPMYGDGSEDWKLTKMFENWKAWCKRAQVVTGVRKFTKSRLHWGGEAYPELHTKASNMKRIIYWLFSELGHAKLTGDPLAQVAFLASRGICGFFDTTDAADIIMTPDETRKAARHGRVFLRSFNAAASIALERNLRLFAVKPKLHYFDHVLRDMDMGGQLQRVNPRHLSNFQEEDLMGKIAKVIKKAHRATMSTTALLRLFLGCLSVADAGGRHLDQ